MNSDLSIIKIEQEDIIKDFKKHIAIDNNERILFSGPFGTGKSTLLKEFFKLPNENYFNLKLFPVNYSVAANEDVFELIKFDLLIQLMGGFYNEIELVEEDFSLLLKSQVFIMERVKLMPVLYAILGMSEKIGQPITGLLKALEKSVSSYKSFSDNLEVNEENDIKDFLKSIENKKGSSKEMDVISGLIFDILLRIKTKRPNSKSVLIIDDLDRLDPEHIFRLFNIFSAHHDEISNSNKFGFDKVIFVCDIENIRKIFHHKYGQEVDFSGYIDKFYSLHPFDFDNRKYVKTSIKKFISRIKFEENLKFYELRDNHRFDNTLTALIISLLDARLLNLRMLQQTIILKVPAYYYGKSNNSGNNSLSTPIIVLFYLLKKFYSSFEILHIKLKHLYELYDKETFSDSTHPDYYISNDGINKDLISYCLPFILSNFEPTGTNIDDNKSEFIPKYQCTVQYNEIRSDYIKFKNFKKATSGNNILGSEIVLNPYQILLDTFEICKSKGIIK